MIVCIICLSLVFSLLVSQLTSLSCENVFHLAVRSPSMNGFIEKLFTDDHYQTRLINRNMHLKPDYDGNLPIHNAAKVVCLD